MFIQTQKTMKRICLLAAICWMVVSAQAQTREEFLQQLLDEQRAEVETLMLYPEETRLHILEAAKYPEALLRLQSIQSRSRKAFRALIEQYPERVQRQVWDLTRYPGLIERLVSDGRGNRIAILRILEEYPAEAREPALAMSEEQFGLLARIDNLERENDAAFRNLVLDYPERPRAALRALLNEPEALDILTEYPRLTIQLGDLYRREPSWMIQQANLINLEAARRRARELESWKQSIESDPDAQRDLQQATQEYARQYQYDDRYYDYDPVERPRQVVIERHYYHPYPWWFGYPYWYDFPRWRPVPYWYDWGFYLQPGGVVVIIDFPSAYFVNWYWRRPVCIYRYPYLANRFTEFYYFNRRSTSTIVIGVERWRVRNAGVVSDAWLADRNGRLERLREFGQMEEARERFNRENPGRQVSQREFVKERTREYPRLSERLPTDEEVARTRSAAPRPTERTPGDAIINQPQRAPSRSGGNPPAEAPRVQPQREPSRSGGNPPAEAPRPKTEPPKPEEKNRSRGSEIME